MPQSPCEANEIDRESHALPLHRIQRRWQNHLRTRLPPPARSHPALPQRRRDRPRPLPSRPQKLAVKAGKLLLHEIQGCLESGLSFGLESPLSGTTHAKLLQQAKSLGFQIEIHYLWIPTPALAIRRIAQRVKMGGHSVPESDVKRRFSRSLNNFLEIYAALADGLTFRNNSVQPASLLFDSANSTLQQVKDFLRQ